MSSQCNVIAECNARVRLSHPILIFIHKKYILEVKKSVRVLKKRRTIQSVPFSKCNKIIKPDRYNSFIFTSRIIIYLIETKSIICMHTKSRQPIKELIRCQNNFSDVFPFRKPFRSFNYLHKMSHKN